MDTPSVERPRRGNSKERVLRAAGYLFSRQGYAATSVDEIATRAQASPSSIYWHFKGGKEDILVAVLEQAAQTYMRRLANQVQEGRTMLEKIDIFLADVRQQVEEQPDTLRLIMQIALERSHADSGVRTRIQNIYRNYRAAMVEEMRKLVPDEETRRLERSAFLVVGLLEGIFLQWQLDSEDVDIDGALQLLRVLIYRQYAGRSVRIPPLPNVRPSSPLAASVPPEIDEPGTTGDAVASAEEALAAARVNSGPVFAAE